MILLGCCRNCPSAYRMQITCCEEYFPAFDNRARASVTMQSSCARATAWPSGATCVGGRVTAAAPPRSCLRVEAAGPKWLPWSNV